MSSAICSTTISFGSGRLEHTDDQVHVFPDHVCVIELKYNQSPDAALTQIEEKGYASRYHARHLPIVGLGPEFCQNGH